MSRMISVAHLTAIELAPPAFIRAAAEAGFDAVGLRLRRVTPTSPAYPLMEDRAAMAETKAALAQTGLAVHDIEFVMIEPELDIATLDPLLDAGAELGARELITAPYDPDLARLADTLGALSERAEARDLGVSLEFFPWAVVPDLAAALALAAQAGPGVGVLADSLHFDRSGSSHEALEQAEPGRLRFAHLSDAPVEPSYSREALLHTAREARLPPGEGQIDLARFLKALPEGLPLGVEVPMDAHSAAHGPEATLSRAATATRALLAEVFGPGDKVPSGAPSRPTEQERPE
ncbi:sugar phosphate isomerase/epimerase family protein [Vannielia litorea]|uniref:sugar phosphate isomerase/epimerase family protein n=1 Tax=Vannielia litorea TaxID=1217970 RepID=UPI001C97B56C|nr:sugar phosphate isomerase/epimerase [Vannielia litorea]MBY6046380.1 sugar phosphate isomerase/epimerase [Vannielia litorea]MBY6073793.1 sugar phosphate isomerase/epimerase [Vannielia litorea]